MWPFCEVCGKSKSIFIVCCDKDQVICPTIRMTSMVSPDVFVCERPKLLPSLFLRFHVSHVLTASLPFKPASPCKEAVCACACVSASARLIVTAWFIAWHLLQLLVMVTECPEHTEKKTVWAGAGQKSNKEKQRLPGNRPQRSSREWDP